MNNEVSETNKEQKEDIRFVYLYVPIKSEVTKTNPKGYGRHKFGMMGFKVVGNKVRVTCCHMGVKDFINDEVKFDREFGLNRIRLRLEGKDTNSKAKRQYIEIPLEIDGKPNLATLKGLNIVNIAHKMFGSNHVHGNLFPLLAGSAGIEEITATVNHQQQSLVNSVFTAISPRLQVTEAKE